jgi:hypothetical protein
VHTSSASARGWENADAPPEPIAEPSLWRSTRYQLAQEFLSQTSRAPRDDSYVGPGSGTIAAPASPGRYRLRVIFYVFIGSAAAIPPRVVWVADDEPHVPVNMTWHTRVELTREIDIETKTAK